MSDVKILSEYRWLFVCLDCGRVSSYHGHRCLRCYSDSTPRSVRARRVRIKSGRKFFGKSELGWMIHPDDYQTGDRPR